jgi:hypothetical protein
MPLPNMPVTPAKMAKLRAGLAAVELWEKDHGRFTTEEMDEARRTVTAQLLCANGGSSEPAAGVEGSEERGDQVEGQRKHER